MILGMEIVDALSGVVAVKLYFCFVLTQGGFAPGLGREGVNKIGSGGFSKTSRGH